jgi:hypothetical protein
VQSFVPLQFENSTEAMYAEGEQVKMLQSQKLKQKEMMFKM